MFSIFRIGPKFLQASVGFGGSCFQKDILNLVYIRHVVFVSYVSIWCSLFYFVKMFLFIYLTILNDILKTFHLIIVRLPIWISQHSSYQSDCSVPDRIESDLLLHACMYEPKIDTSYRKKMEENKFFLQYSKRWMLFLEEWVLDTSMIVIRHLL